VRVFESVDDTVVSDLAWWAGCCSSIGCYSCVVNEIYFLYFLFKSLKLLNKRKRDRSTIEQFSYTKTDP